MTNASMELMSHKRVSYFELYAMRGKSASSMSCKHLVFAKAYEIDASDEFDKLDKINNIEKIEQNDRLGREKRR